MRSWGSLYLQDRGPSPRGYKFWQLSIAFELRSKEMSTRVCCTVTISFSYSRLLHQRGSAQQSIMYRERVRCNYWLSRCFHLRVPLATWRLLLRSHWSKLIILAMRKCSICGCFYLQPAICFSFKWPCLYKGDVFLISANFPSRILKFT